MELRVLCFRNALQPLPGEFAEEERWLPPAMDLESSEFYDVEPEGGPIRPEDEADAPHFVGFLDGVQRSVRAGILRTREGMEVPISIARVTAGLVGRREADRTLWAGPRRSWNLLVAPFRLAGEEPESLAEQLRMQEVPAWTGREAFGIGGDFENFRKLLTPDTPWILADTSFSGISEEGTLLSRTVLWQERTIRSRAQGRIAHLRQVLELLLLIAFRLPELGEMEDLPVDWTSQAPILVDGPLLLSTRRRRWMTGLLAKMGIQMGEGQLEKTILGRTVGLVKSHRLRPRDLARILTLPAGHRSSFRSFSQEVDIHGRDLREDIEAEEDHRYPSWHLTAYVRFRRHPDSALEGLIRIDLLRPCSANGQDLLSPEERQTLHAWAAAVYRERRPFFPGGRDQPYPIAVLEQMLHARIPPPAVLARTIRLQTG